MQVRSDWTARILCVLAFVSASLAGCGVPGPDGPADSFGLDLSMPPGSSVDGAMVFVVDGLNARTFQAMLDAGELPALKKHFVDRGLYAPRAVANTPSVTMANLTTLATGVFPGHHGVTGINWFDRNALIWRDHTTIAQKNLLDGDYVAPTIFEQFPDRTTFSVFFQPHRGATKFVENWMSAGPPFFFGWYEFVDRLTLWRLNLVAEAARRDRRWPAVTYVYLLATDFRGYAGGPQSQEYRRALRHTDRQIGRVLGDFQRAGLLDRLVVALTSDHGMMPVAKHFPLQPYLASMFLDVAPRHLWESTSFDRRSAYYNGHPCVYYGSGDRYAALCLRKPIRDKDGKLTGFEPWPVRPSASDLKAYPATRLARTLKDHPINRLHDLSEVNTDVNLPKILVDLQAVDAAAYLAGPNCVRVVRTGGQVEFRQDGGRGAPITYHVILGTDPLGWAGKVPAEALGGAPFSEREWLDMTAETEFPDLPAQILAYFRAPRAGDIAVFAAEGWDFNDSLRGGHGGLGPVDMHVPLLLAGPGVPRGRLATARTADLVPTLLTLLGRPIPRDFDGRPLTP